jgi:hypothetical protein
MRSLRFADGQASVELVAVLPLVGLLVALAWQALLAGEAIWLDGVAARGAARAQALGGDPLRAARAALPGRFERGLRVQTDRGGAVAVTVRVPAVLGHGRIASFTARARFEAQR